MSLATPRRGRADTVIVIVFVVPILAQSEQTVGYVSKATPTVSHNFPPTATPVPQSSL